MVRPHAEEKRWAVVDEIAGMGTGKRTKESGAPVHQMEQ